MKTFSIRYTYFSIRFIFVLLTILLLSASCKKDRDEAGNPLAQLQKRLSGVWTVNNVTLSGMDVTVYYQGLTVDFNDDLSFTCEKPVDPVWPISGHYENQLENNQHVIVRSDNVRMFVTVLNASELVIQFPWTGKAPSGGRAASLNGEYQFTFTR